MLGEETSRWLRAGIMLLFLILYISRFYAGRLFAIVFVGLTLCDIFLIFYDNINFKLLTYVSRIIAYLSIIKYLWPYLKKLNFNLFTSGVSIFILLINIYLLSVMIQAVPEIDGNYIFYPLFYLFGFSLLGMTASGISFHNRFSNRKSFQLVMACFGLVLSDICFYIAYYLDFFEFYYIDRITNILGVGFLLAFASYGKIKAAKVEMY